MSDLNLEDLRQGAPIVGAPPTAPEPWLAYIFAGACVVAGVLYEISQTVWWQG